MRASPLGKVLLSFSGCFLLAAILLNSISWVFVVLVLISLFIYGRLRLVAEIEELDIEVKREVLEEMIYAKEKATIKVEILNKGEVPINGQIEDRIPSELELIGGENVIDVNIAPKTILRFMYSVIAEKRGEYVIKSIRLRFEDRFGLNQAVIDIDCRSTLNVHTERKSLETARRISRREHLRFSGITKNPALILKEFEFDGIREYIPGDKARDILWKALPKLDELLTKIYRKEGTLKTFILLDCSRSMRLAYDGTSMLDHGVDIAIQISQVLLSSLQPTGILMFDEASVIDEALPATGRHQFDRIVAMLRRAPASIGATTQENLRLLAAPMPKTDRSEESHSDKRFFETLGQLVDLGTATPQGIGLENRIKKWAAKEFGSKLLFVLISDLISSRDSALSAARFCQKTDNVLIIMHTYADWYTGISSKFERMDAEKLYGNLMSSLDVEAKLRRMGAHYLRVGPADSTARIVKAIRRGM